MNRREYLTLIGTGALVGVSQMKASYVGGAGFTTESVRKSEFGNVVGGIYFTTESNHAGTVGLGMDLDGNKVFVTSRHIIDDNFCEGDSSNLIGENVYQIEKRKIGQVQKVSKTGGIKSTDWAIIDIDEKYWSDKILGIPNVGTSMDYFKNDRIVLSGANSGLTGGKITNVSTGAKLSGCLIDKLVEYEIDGNVNTKGDSGSIVGKFDSNNIFRPIALHSFANNQKRYGIPFTDLLNNTTLSFTNSDRQIIINNDITEIDATVINYNKSNNTATILISNIGNSDDSVDLRILDTSNKTELDSQTVTLTKQSSKFITLNAPTSFYLDYEYNTKLINKL